MTEPAHSAVSLDSVLAALLEMLERGQAHDRQAWLSRFPEYAAELEEFFTSLERLEPWAAPLRTMARAMATEPRAESKAR